MKYKRLLAIFVFTIMVLSFSCCVYANDEGRIQDKIALEEEIAKANENAAENKRATQSAASLGNNLKSSGTSGNVESFTVDAGKVWNAAGLNASGQYSSSDSTEIANNFIIVAKSIRNVGYCAAALAIAFVAVKGLLVQSATSTESVKKVIIDILIGVAVLSALPTAFRFGSNMLGGLAWDPSKH